MSASARDLTTQVTTSVRQVLDANTKRKALILSNVNATIFIFVSPNPNMTPNTGLVLTAVPSGQQSIVFDTTEMKGLIQGRLFAIATGTVNLGIIEVT